MDFNVFMTCFNWDISTNELINQCLETQHIQFFKPEVFGDLDKATTP